MVIQRWDPFGEMTSLRSVMDRLFEDAFVRTPFAGSSGQQGGAMAMPLDIYEEGDNFEIKASLPGVKPEDVNVTVQGNTLSIEGELRDDSQGKGTTHHREHRYGRFYRSVTLPTQVNSEQAQASFEQGVLKLTLPKVETARSRQIPVRGGQSASIETTASKTPELSKPSGNGETTTKANGSKAGAATKA